MGSPGSLFDVTTHTSDHRDCPGCNALRSHAEMHPSDPFADAALRWLESRRNAIRPKTWSFYRQNIKSLNLFFSNLPLNEIHIGHIRQYQESRLRGEFIRKRRPQEEPQPIRAKPKQVNQEISTLHMVLDHAGLWTPELEKFTEPTAEDSSDIPRALTPAEQSRWLQCAQMDELIFQYSVGAFDTCAATNEMRGFHIGDVRTSQGILTVPARASKNKYRTRTIPLVNADAIRAFDWLLIRAQSLGATEPEHFLFPVWIGGTHYDPTRPMTASGLKRRWNAVRQASGLTHFRLYDTRHTAITRLAEQGVPVPVIMARAGHVSARMNQHYTQVSFVAQRRWLEKRPSQPVEIRLSATRFSA